MTFGRLVAPLLVLALAGCGRQPPVPEETRPIDAPLVRDDDGSPRRLAVRVCRPSLQGADEAPLAIINHGAPTNPDDIARMQPTSCDSEPAQWFMARGFVVVFALRRGFGRSGGAVAEDSGSCDAPDFRHSGEEGGRDIDAVVRWAMRLPGIRGDATVVVGQSTGGWAALGYAARADAQAAAVINMAGGRGGRAFGAAGTYCHAERLVEAAAGFGGAARVPTLWIYAGNDSYFTPDLATRLAAAYQAAGGNIAFVPVGPFADDGHQLFYGAGGSRIWGPIVARFLTRTLPSARPSVTG